VNHFASSDEMKMPSRPSAISVSRQAPFSAPAVGDGGGGLLAQGLSITGAKISILMKHSKDKVPGPDPHRLRFGHNRRPRFRLGQIHFCAVRGECEVVGLSDAPIPWPIGNVGRARSLIIFGALERAVRQEANVAVCHQWGGHPAPSRNGARRSVLIV